MKTMKSFSKKANFRTGGTKPDVGPEEGFEELCRQATAKTLQMPNPELNQQVVDSITADPANAPSPQFVAATMRNRLLLKNPHKVWLSLELVREVMDKCPAVTQDDWRDVLVEINRMASKPMNRYASDLPIQQKAKGAAFSLLRHLANEPTDSPMNSPRSPRGKNGNNFTGNRSPKSPSRTSNEGPPSNAWPRIRHAVHNQLALVNSKLETVQEAVVSLSSGEARENADAQQDFLKGVVAEMEGYRTKFEPLLSQLSSFDSPEATALMSKALETMDMINNIINLQDEVLNAKKNPLAAASHPKADSGRLAPITPPGSLPSKAQPKSDPLDAIAELQQALTGMSTDSTNNAGPRSDPFAASSLDQSLPSYPSYSSNPFKPAPYNPLASPSVPPSYGNNPYQLQQHGYDPSSISSTPQDSPFGPPSSFGHQQQNSPFGNGSGNSNQQNSYNVGQQYNQQPYNNGPQPHGSWAGNASNPSTPFGGSNTPSASYNTQFNSTYPPQPNSQHHASQNQHQHAPPQSYHGSVQQGGQMQSQMSNASSDAWNMPALHPSHLSTSHGGPNGHSVAQPTANYSSFSEPNTQFHSDPPPSHSPQKPAEQSTGGDWESLFARNASQPTSAAPSTNTSYDPNVTSTSQSQLGSHHGSHSSLPAAHEQFNPPTSAFAAPPHQQPSQQAQKQQRESDPFDELFSVRGGV